MPEMLNDVFQTLGAQAAPALAEVLETTAFLCAVPLSEPSSEQAPPLDALRIWMTFSGPTSGTVEIIAPQALGQLINEGMLCSDAIDSEQSRRDALLELMNMTCGTLFHHASQQLNAPFNIGLPQSQPFDVQAHWEDFLSQSGATLLDVEGHLVAIRVAVNGAS